jgi:uncharacterized glyoxalase superfamily protein PhnB
LVENPPEGFPRITPYLLYEDVDAAVDWLVNAAGFTERLRIPGPDGTTNHADRTYGAEDPEGHQWSFAQHVRDVGPADLPGR